MPAEQKCFFKVKSDTMARMNIFKLFKIYYCLQQETNY